MCLLIILRMLSTWCVCVRDTDVKFIKMDNDPTKNLLDFHIISEDILHVEWETTPGYERDSLVTSEIHATLVTSYARRV